MCATTARFPFSTVGEDRRTTLMIKNIPNKYTQKMLLALIEEKFRCATAYLGGCLLPGPCWHVSKIPSPCHYSLSGSADSTILSTCQLILRTSAT